MIKFFALKWSWDHVLTLLLKITYLLRMSENGTEPDSVTQEKQAPLPDDFGGEIVEWARSLPPWQQDIVARLAGGGELTEPEIADTCSRLLESVGYSDGRSPTAPKAVAEGLFGSTALGSTKIVSLGQLEGVNGLEFDEPQTLDFAKESLTLVYGSNAAGKTSYARTLKHVGRAVGERPEILPNVKSKGPHPKPTAHIVLEIDGAELSIDAELNEPAPTVCSAIQAFDSKCAETYVAEENRVDFTPQILSIFDRVVGAQARVRDSIQERIDEIHETRPEFDRFGENTAVGKAIADLSAKTELEGIRELAKLSDEESTEMESLKASLAATGPALDQQIGAARSAATQARALAKNVEGITAIVSDDAITRRAGLREDANTKARAAGAAEKAAFGESPRKLDVADAWDELWSAAHEFFHLVDGDNRVFPPNVEGDICPLCKQELSPEARSRFQAFAAFVVDNTAASARQARSDQQASEEQLAAQLPALAGEQLEAIRAARSEMAELVDGYAEIAQQRAEALRTNDVKEGLASLPISPVDGLSEFAESEDARAEQLNGLKDPEKREVQALRFKELADRKLLESMIGAVSTWHSNLPELEALEAAKSLLGSRGITQKHGQLADRVITQTYLENLRAELEFIGLEYFDVKAVPRGEAGARVVQIKMKDFDPGVGLPDVLSEGEQRGLGFACFLAEVTTLGGDGPIVLDDPVSSFDQSRRELVAVRLHDESQKRQVIVFSHDLPFTYYLDRVGGDRNQEIALRYVQRFAGAPGYVVKSGPPELLKPPTVVHELKLMVPELPDEQKEGRLITAVSVQGWYVMLRNAWERTVEKNLLRGVVTRFDRAVKTQALTEVRVGEELVNQVTAAMSRCSKYAHDAPIADGVELPTKEEMLADAEALSKFLADLNDLKKEIKEAGAVA